MPFKYLGVTEDQQTPENDINRGMQIVNEQGIELPPSPKLTSPQSTGTGKKFKYLGPEEEEGFLKSSARSLYQIPSAAAQLFTSPIDMMKAYPEAQALEDYLQEYSEEPEKKYDIESIRQRLEPAKKVSEAIPIPTQREAEEYVEKKTGAPLTPKTEFQKGIRTSTQTAIMAPGSFAVKVGAAVMQPMFQKYSESLGIDKNFAEPMSQGMAILWAILQKGKGGVPGIEEMDISKILDESKDVPPGGTPPPTRPTPPGERPTIETTYPGEYEYGEKYIKEPFKEAATKPIEKIAEKTLKPSERIPEAAKERFIPIARRPSERIPEAAKERLMPKPPEITKPVPGERQLPVTLSTMRGEPTGRQLKVQPITEGNEISDLAARELGIRPGEVTAQQRTKMHQQLRTEGLKLAKPPEQNDQAGRMVHSVSPIESGNKEVLGNTFKKVFNEREREVSEQASNLYDAARDATDQVVDDVTELVPTLQNLHDTHINSSNPVLADVAKEANKLIREISTEEGPIPVSFSFLINRIKELRVGSKYKFSNDPTHAYNLLTDVIENYLNTAEGASAEAVQLWKEANDFYRNDYAKVFKNENVFDILNAKDINYEKQYDKLTKPSIYNFVEPELRNTPQGVRILDAAKRDILKSKFSEAFKNKKSINRSDVEDVLDDIGIHTTPEERLRIYNSLRDIEAEKITSREQQARLQERKIQKPSKPEKPQKIVEKKREYADIRKKEWWRTATSKQAADKMDIIDGLKIAKQMLPEEKYAKLAHAAGIRRIMNKKVPDESIHQTMEKMLKNADDREYVEYALGKQQVKDFEKRIEDVKKYETDVKEYESKVKQIEKQETAAQKKEAKEKLKAEKDKMKVKIEDTYKKKIAREITHRVLDVIPYVKHAPREMKSAVAEKLFPKK